MKHPRLDLVFAVLILAAISAPVFADDAERVALVMGNAGYRHLPALRNPVNDASDMAAALTQAGFAVRLVTDAGLAEAEEAVRAFAADLESADVGLFYYAGHGVQAEGINYLVPVDADVQSNTELRFKTLNADFVLEYMRSAETPFNIVILDACRDNPFATSRSASRGLAVLPAPRGSLIAYATSPGDVAEDGAGRNGTFTAALLNHLTTPGLDIKEVFDRVGIEVTTGTANRQVPWVLSSFFGRFSFVAGDSDTGEVAAGRRPDRVSTAVGTVMVRADVDGELYLDGVALGEVRSTGARRIPEVQAGERIFELRFGERAERKVVQVPAGGSVEVAFAYEDDVAAGRFEGIRPAVFADRFPGLETVDYDSWESGRPGGVVRVGLLGTPPATFNPVTARTFLEKEVVQATQGTLVRRNQLSLRWEPHLAESWTSAEDGRSITLRLRRGLRWSDGVSLDADDFVWAVNEVYLAEDSPYSEKDFFIVDGRRVRFEALDEHSIRVSSTVPYAGLLELANISPLPRHVLEPLLSRGGMAALAGVGSAENPTGLPFSGPFVIGSVEGRQVTLRANSYYHERDEAGRRLPYLDGMTLVYEAHPEDLIGGIADESLDYAIVAREYVDVVVDRFSDYRVVNAGPSTNTVFIAFNMNPVEGPGDGGIRPPVVDWTNNKTFRIAMAHLVNRDRILEESDLVYAVPQYSPVWTNSPYYWREAEFLGYSYNPERAARLLDSIDFVDRDGDGVREDPDGNPLELELRTNNDRARVAVMESMIEEAAAVGVRIRGEVVPFGDLVERLTTSYDWEMVIIGLSGSVDPIGGGNVYPSWGPSHLVEPLQESPRREWEALVDEAWAQANFTLDEEERRAGFRVLQQIWTEEVPWIFTYNEIVTVAAGIGLGNVKPHAVFGGRWVGFAHRLYFR